MKFIVHGQPQSISYYMKPHKYTHPYLYEYYYSAYTEIMVMY